MLARNFGIFLCLWLPGLIRSEFYSSIDTLITLENVEKELVTATRDYLSQQEEQLNMYSDFLLRVKLEHALALEQLEHGEDPVQAFRLTKRLVEDWPELLTQLEVNQPKEDYKTVVDVLSKEMGLPERADLVGAVKGLITLQNTYNLTASQLSKGYLGKMQTDTIMDWRDSYEIGVQLYELRWYTFARDWFIAAVKLMNDAEDTNAAQALIDVIEYLALTNIELGDKEASLEYLNELIEADASPTAQHTLNYVSQKVLKSPVPYSLTDSYAHYAQLCQNNIPAEAIAARRKLNCYLDFKRDAIYRIGPLKVEQAHLNPDINIYHGVLNDDQIDDLLNIADEFEKVRSTVGGNKVIDLRVSQQVWLNYTQPALQNMRYLVGAMSGLNKNNTELAQIANYGIGGQYALHHDHIEKLPPYYLTKGNRLATAMFYLSDVVQGGHTVFSRLNISLQPVKGSVVIWNNALRSLENNVLTEHAGCPVIEGSKRIANIWVHSAEQEFFLPCTLNSNE